MVKYAEMCMELPQLSRRLENGIEHPHDWLRPSITLGLSVVWEMTQYLQATQGVGLTKEIFNHQ